jgi:predicted RNase H-like nuclease
VPNVDYLFTEELETVYGLLSDAEADVVDAVIIRLLDEHESAWARQNRVVGDRGSAWIIEFRHHRDSFHLYWRYLDDETVVLLVLRRVREESAGP